MHRARLPRSGQRYPRVWRAPGSAAPPRAEHLPPSSSILLPRDLGPRCAAETAQLSSLVASSSSSPPCPQRSPLLRVASCRAHPQGRGVLSQPGGGAEQPSPNARGGAEPQRWVQDGGPGSLGVAGGGDSPSAGGCIQPRDLIAG